MKKVWMLICLFFGLSLFGCNQTKQVTDVEIEKLLKDLTIDQTKLSATSVYEIDGHKIDRFESIDFNYESGIYFHLVISSEKETYNRDVKVYITSTYIYETENMTKVAHQIDLGDEGALWAFIYTYLDLISPIMLNRLDLYRIALVLRNPTLSKTANGSMLRGKSGYQSNHSDDMVDMTEIVFNKKEFLEYHFRLEYLYESTKEKSNYVSGRHYYFKHGPVEAFPSLSLFTE